MHFSKVTGKRSICINGDWDFIEYEITVKEGDALKVAEITLEDKLDEWENGKRIKRNISPEENLPKVQVEKTPQQQSAIILAEIYDCRTLMELNEYKLLITKDQLAQKAYDIMHKKLSNPEGLTKK